MMRLIIVCATLLLSVGMRECHKTYRVALQMDDRASQRAADFLRWKLLQEQRPSLEIDPGVRRGKEKL